MTARKHDKKGRTTGKFADSHIRELLQPDETPFFPFTKGLLASASFRALTVNGYRGLFRLVFEYMSHPVEDNGKLPCTHADFRRWGIHKDAVHDTLIELQTLGFIVITIPGRKSYGSFKGRPNQFRLTLQPVITDGDAYARTNDWKNRFQTVAEARLAVQKAIAASRSNRAKSEKETAPSRASEPQEAVACAV